MAATAALAPDKENSDNDSKKRKREQETASKSDPSPALAPRDPTAARAAVGSLQDPIDCLDDNPEEEERRGQKRAEELSRNRAQDLLRIRTSGQYVHERSVSACLKAIVAHTFPEGGAATLDTSFMKKLFLSTYGATPRARWLSAGIKDSFKEHSRRPGRPSLKEDSLIALPIYHGSHFNALLRIRTDDCRVLFLYADTLCSPERATATEQIVRSATDEIDPDAGLWINDRSRFIVVNTFEQSVEGNDCGPDTCAIIYRLLLLWRSNPAAIKALIDGDGCSIVLNGLNAQRMGTLARDIMEDVISNENFDQDKEQRLQIHMHFQDGKGENIKGNKRKKDRNRGRNGKGKKQRCDKESELESGTGMGTGTG